MSNNVRAFKLLSGQEIIGICTEVGVDTVKLKKIREIAPSRQQNGEWTLSLAAYLFSDIDGEFELRISNTAGEIIGVPSELEREYRNVVSSIQLATSIPGRG